MWYHSGKYIATPVVDYWGQNCIGDSRKGKCSCLIGIYELPGKCLDGLFWKLVHNVVQVDTTTGITHFGVVLHIMSVLSRMAKDSL